MIQFIESWMIWVIEIDFRRRVIKGLSPQLHLLLAEFIHCLLFALALQMSVVPLIQPPRLVNISLILEAHLLKNNIRCVSCSKQSWRVPHIKMITKFIEERSSFRWLFDTFFTQRTIDPPLKNTILVHCWLTVSNKNNRNNITISIGLAVVWQILLIIYNQVVVDATQIDIWKAWWHF